MSQDSASATAIWFDDPRAIDIALVGGKGANLGRLTEAGFDVPGGFILGTAAYAAHLEAGGRLKSQIAAILAKVDYDDAADLERSVTQIRRAITAETMPATLAEEIRQGYARLGQESYVAVRSSGTAEDLAGASFAGLHDTYLDRRGAEDVIDAVKRCWASLWTARAVFYRKTQGFDHFTASIAVVIQTMVASEISGVMFTANPLNAATDQIVINASWGLGEAIVAGVVTPDEFVIRHRNLKILHKSLGTKTVQAARDSATGRGTVLEPVAEQLRAAWVFTDEQAAALARIGRRIQAYYGDFPQDIEWAYRAGQFHVLQARPITGVEFTWDADVTASVPGNDDGGTWDEVWSRNYPEEMWTGAITPLMFSWRGWGLCEFWGRGARLWGFPELDYHQRRLWIYHRGASYYNPATDRDLLLLTSPPPTRAGLLSKLPMAWQEEVMNAPFDWTRYMGMFERVERDRPEVGSKWWQFMNEAYIQNPAQVKEFSGLSFDELKTLADGDLKTHIRHLIDIEVATYDCAGLGMLMYLREAMGWLNWMVENWYQGDRPGIFLDLITGTREPTITTKDNLAIWSLAERINASPVLKALFEQYPDRHFFDHLEASADGRDFATAYTQHVAERGHRGHSDRDIYFTRRAEDPMIDLRMFKSLMGTPDPRINERRVVAKLEETIAHVTENIASGPLGIFKAYAFKVLNDFVQKSITCRDDEREFVDRSTFAIKRGFMEVGRRIFARGDFTSERDFYFLTMDELYAMLDGTANMPLTKAKIAARMKNFDRVNTKEVYPPYYLQYGRPVDLDTPVPQGEGVLRGKVTSVGKVTGTARVVRELTEIGTVQKGDILIVNATDPGWTPVFMIIKGIVLETGGPVSHGAMLAREYGLPGVQIEGALQLIPDGATITLDGDSGLVIIHCEDDEPQARSLAA